jgi:hypothetical protein
MVDKNLLKFLFHILGDSNYEKYRNNFKVELLRSVIVFFYCIIFFNILFLILMLFYRLGFLNFLF